MLPRPCTRTDARLPLIEISGFRMQTNASPRIQEEYVENESGICVDARDCKWSGRVREIFSPRRIVPFFAIERKSGSEVAAFQRGAGVVLVESLPVQNNLTICNWSK